MKYLYTVNFEFDTVVQWVVLLPQSFKLLQGYAAELVLGGCVCVCGVPSVYDPHQDNVLL